MLLWLQLLLLLLQLLLQLLLLQLLVQVLHLRLQVLEDVVGHAPAEAVLGLEVRHQRTRVVAFVDGDVRKLAT